MTEIPGKKNDGHAGGGLAEEAAAWVPPWAREPESPVSHESAEDEPGTDEAHLEILDGAQSEDSLDEAAAPGDDLVPDEVPVEAVPSYGDLLADGEASVETAELPRPRISTETMPVSDDVPSVELSHAGEQPIEAEKSAEVESLPQAEPVSHPAAVTEPMVTDVPPTEVVDATPPEAEVAQHASTPELTMPGLADDELISALEAIMLVVDEPVSEILLSQVLEVPAEQIAGALIDLSAAYIRESRGFDLRRAAGGWRFYTRAEYAPYVERFVLDGQQLRLTQASLETLAVVAYKQPVTRSRISAIRGVNCDGVIRTLVTRGMIEECGTEPESGAYLYRTTTLFLEKLGLDSVEQLPSLAPFLPENVEEIADEQR